jgi:hypothetical protein
VARAAAATSRRRSPRGSSRTSPRSPSGAPRSTT